MTQVFNDDTKPIKLLSIPLIHHIRGMYVIKEQARKYQNIQKRYLSYMGSLLCLVDN